MWAGQVVVSYDEYTFKLVSCVTCSLLLEEKRRLRVTIYRSVEPRSGEIGLLKPPWGLSFGSH